MPSHISGAGIGLFAVSHIKAGTIVWTFNSSFDRKFVNLPKHPIAKEFIVKYGYKPLKDSQVYYLSIDNMRFINHATNPNIIPQLTHTSNADLVAKHDIGIGLELTLDYTLNFLTDDPGSQKFYSI